ncbi:MAG: SpoIID/LytB domain-containing protein [Acidobacteria bacterium]|nr:SpoIID/LytB domain-containing protein [Acidobacteriota bacterium]
MADTQYVIGPDRRAAPRILILLALLAASCARYRGPELPGAPAPSGGPPVTIRALLPQGRVVSLDLEDYVIGAVLGEVSPAGLQADAAERVLEVQALLARTYAIAHLGRHAAEGFDLCSSTHCQAFVDPGHAGAATIQIVRHAAQRTRSLVILATSGPIEAVFHASCGGHTSASTTVWPSAGYPYLRGVADPYCVRENEAHWTWTADAAELLLALRQHAVTRVATVADLKIVERDEAGRVTRLSVGVPGEIIHASDFRTAILRAFGPRSLRSTRFSVARRGSRYHFEGTGNGHGVGLCQAGAIARARAGQSTEQIIRTYYPGTHIGNLEARTRGQASIH